METRLPARRCSLRPSTWLALLATGIAMVGGWCLFWHMADDAYITYRYLSNAMAGRGLVWNPAPFAPTDGNTDFLWSMLLLAVWRLFGAMPPDIANWLNLGFGWATLFVIAHWAERVRLPAALDRRRSVVVWLVLASVVLNRAFLASLSSGLGMALFNLNLLIWCRLACSTRIDDSAKRWFGVSAAAALTGLSRPEGHLAVAATCALLLLLGWSRRRCTMAIAIVIAVAPIVAHLVFRRLTYGDWLPCTYYAKTVAAWPASGIRFAASFVVEFAAYVWLLVAAAWLWQNARRPTWLAAWRAQLGAAAVVGVCLFHFAYYTFYMGGDLFEWRVYTHLVFLMPLSLVVMTADLRAAAGLPVAATALLLAQPIPWLKFAVNDGPIAPHLPSWASVLVEPYDTWQQWLNEHIVCMRNFHMKLNFKALADQVPTRAEGERIPFDGYPVYPAAAVGLVGWVFPNVAIIDVHGLNDWVIAHTAVPTAEERQLHHVQALGARFDYFDQDHDGRVTIDEFQPWYAALFPGPTPEEVARNARAALDGFDTNHDQVVTKAEYIAANGTGDVRRHAHERAPPAGYLAGFRPNVELHNKELRVSPRSPPLTATEIRQHEAHYRAMFADRR